MKRDGKHGPFWLASTGQLLALLPERYLVLKTSFFLQKRTDPGPAAHREALGGAQAHSRALYHCRLQVQTWPSLEAFIWPVPQKMPLLSGKSFPLSKLFFDF